MTLPTNYNNLIQSIQEELEDTGSEFVLNVPTAISMAEYRINKDLDGVFQNSSASLAVAAGTASVNKPQGYRFAYTVFIRPSIGGARTLLKKMSKDFIIDYSPNSTTQGVPKYYADNTSTTFILGPTPNTTYTLEVDFATYVTPLSPSNQTNLIIDKYPDLLWYGTLVEQTVFARMFEASALYEAKYQARLQGIVEEMRRERADNTYNVDKPIVSQNRKDRQG